MNNLKLICNKDLLLQYINIVNKAVSNRTTLPILECILLTADEKGFLLTGNDLELGIKTASIEAEIFEQGEIAIEARIFNDIIRRLNGENVTITTDEKNAVNILCGSSEFTIMGQSGEDFPALPEVEQNQAYTLKQNNLRNMIRQTIFSIAQDNAKPVLTGELFEFNGDFFSIVSVDGYRISYRKNNLISSFQKTEVIVPGKTLSELNKILSQEDEELVSVYITDKHILFDLGTAIMVSRLIDGDFIRYEQSFSEDYKTEILVNKNELIQSLERASLVSRDNRKTPVRFQIKSKSLEITAKSDMGTAFEEISAEIDGQEITIAFNPRYFIEALRSIDEERVRIHFTASLSPCTILPVEGDSYKYLILPLRM
ncbi:DNA polymerase III subunit beta [Anaerotignum neopropionicum]|uniref:DNA polymerase III subunit beta n=1 Tax=Anaerotignum neopropionicum TaxID=36847 RepID=UPI001FA7339E|nr:DNA polymerase III subunit beta [Anaerotignum neopropionicum]